MSIGVRLTDCRDLIQHLFKLQTAVYVKKVDHFNSSPSKAVIIGMVKEWMKVRFEMMINMHTRSIAHIDTIEKDFILVSELKAIELIRNLFELESEHLGRLLTELVDTGEVKIESLL